MCDFCDFCVIHSSRQSADEQRPAVRDSLLIFFGVCVCWRVLFLLFLSLFFKFFPSVGDGARRIYFFPFLLLDRICGKHKRFLTKKKLFDGPSDLFFFLISLAGPGI